eukprot:5278854-Ditylum_brightwellii.AAC.1
MVSIRKNPRRLGNSGGTLLTAKWILEEEPSESLSKLADYRIAVQISDAEFPNPTTHNFLLRTIEVDLAHVSSSLSSEL